MTQALTSSTVHSVTKEAEHLDLAKITCFHMQNHHLEIHPLLLRVTNMLIALTVCADASFVRHVTVKHEGSR